MLVFALLFCVASAALALDFPPLTGRVVDQAGVMTADGREGIEAKSKELEDESGIQLGVDGIISVLHGDSAEWQPKAALRVDDIRTGDLGALLMFLFIVTLLVVAVRQNVRSGHYVVRRSRRVFVPAGHSSSSSSWSNGDSSSGSSSDSDFSGGGDSSGGGTSGSW
jgi:uncharacterized protein